VLNKYVKIFKCPKLQLKRLKERGEGACTTVEASTTAVESWLRLELSQRQLKLINGGWACKAYSNGFWCNGPPRRWNHIRVRMMVAASEPWMGLLVRWRRRWYLCGGGGGGIWWLAALSMAHTERLNGGECGFSGPVGNGVRSAWLLLTFPWLQCWRWHSSIVVVHFS